MRSAKLVAQRFPDVVFFVVGTDKVEYGGDANYTGGKTFKDWVLSREEFDLSKFVFTGRLEPQQLGRLLAASDLHVYLTVPFVLSWSMMDAMSCGAVVLGSATAPVVEMIRDGAFSSNDRRVFRPIYDSLLEGGDRYMLLADFESYADCQRLVGQAYHDRDRWTRMSIMNVAHMGKFSSDRSIKQYCDEIWGVTPVHP